MLLSTFIVSFYMILVYVVGGEDGALTWKIVLVGISLLGIIAQYSRGRAKGKSPAEALVDDDFEGIITSIKSVVIKTDSKANDGEE